MRKLHDETNYSYFLASSHVPLQGYKLGSNSTNQPCIFFSFFIDFSFYYVVQCIKQNEAFKNARKCYNRQVYSEHSKCD